MARRVYIAREGEEHSISIPEDAWDTLPVGPQGETYKDLGYRRLAYEENREPYKETKRAVPRAEAEEKKG
jgi:hypothetical protein